MTHAERDWRDGQPGDAAVDGSTGLQAERTREDGPLAEGVHGDPLAERVHEDPLVGDVHDDQLVAAAPEDPVAADVLGADPPAEPVPGAAGQEPHGQVTGDGERDRFMTRWQEIQAGFVEEPRRAVQDADALVVDLMDRLARMLAEERDRLEPRPGTGEDVSTEDLRQGLRRYRSLFERLLAV